MEVSVSLYHDIGMVLKTEDQKDFAVEQGVIVHLEFVGFLSRVHFSHLV